MKPAAIVRSSSLTATVKLLVHSEAGGEQGDGLVVDAVDHRDDRTRFLHRVARVTSEPERAEEHLGLGVFAEVTDLGEDELVEATEQP